ncbi:hypothetical protein THAOC_10941 [Thalassiosira oceanica]|uniref:Uncharacterized protein n=1 Tax=Thalassiosira oceanica TaxID=159749 RepID=K0SSG5_THAOC|nr:hypothetical protein THAOC_10941 [Thalassiosira oceanica]|eukprot:EJK67944.1 hypothetical protein THAOC_10941 [Thalassiosira oceanica]
MNPKVKMAERERKALAQGLTFFQNALPGFFAYLYDTSALQKSHDVTEIIPSQATGQSTVTSLRPKQPPTSIHPALPALASPLPAAAIRDTILRKSRRSNARLCLCPGPSPRRRRRPGEHHLASLHLPRNPAGVHPQTTSVVRERPSSMKTLDGGCRRASASPDLGNSSNPVKDFVNRRIKRIPSSISVESTANSSVCEPTLSTEQTRLSLNEDCSLDSSDEYRSYRSLRSTQSGSAPSWPRTSLTSADSGFDGYLQDAKTESNELMVEWTTGSEERRGRGRVSIAMARTKHMNFAQVDEIPPSAERSQKDTQRRGRRGSGDSDNGLNDSFNSFNSITGALQGIKSSLTIPKRRSSAMEAEKSSGRSRGRSQRSNSFYSVNSIEINKDRVDRTRASDQKSHSKSTSGSIRQQSFRSQSTSGSIPQGRRVSFKKRPDIRNVKNVVEEDQFYTQDDDNEAIEEILEDASSTRKFIRRSHLSSHESYNKMTGLPSPEALREGLPSPEIIVGIEHLLCRSGAGKASAAVKTRHSQALFNEQARQQELGIEDPKALAMVLEKYSGMSAKLAECRAIYSAAI